MKHMAIVFGVLFLLAGCGTAATEGRAPEADKHFNFPGEAAKHEGTWLIWPHRYTYGAEYCREIEPVWLAMAAALHKGERVHIIVYNGEERARVKSRMAAEGLDEEQFDFVIAESDDVWVRDTGPLFVTDEQGGLAIADFAFTAGEKRRLRKKMTKYPARLHRQQGYHASIFPALYWRAARWS